MKKIDDNNDEVGAIVIFVIMLVVVCLCMGRILRNEGPRNVKELLEQPFTQYISNGRMETSCLGKYCEECNSPLFSPPTVEKLQISEDDKSTAGRILESVEWQRRDLDHIQHLLPSSPEEGVEIRKKLRECDEAGKCVLAIKKHKEHVESFNQKKAKYQRLRTDLPRLQEEADIASQQKTDKEDELRVKKQRKQVLQAVATRQERERRARTQQLRQETLDTDITEPLLEPFRCDEEGCLHVHQNRHGMQVVGTNRQPSHGHQDERESVQVAVDRQGTPEVGRSRQQQRSERKYCCAQ